MKKHAIKPGQLWLTRDNTLVRILEVQAGLVRGARSGFGGNWTQALTWTPQGRYYVYKAPSKNNLEAPPDTKPENHPLDLVRTLYDTRITPTGTKLKAV